MDNKKYVALIMNRIYAKNGDYIYTVSHPEIGYVDKKTKIFKDRNGVEYISMMDTSLMMSEVNDAYYAAVPVDEICERLGVQPLRRAISMYNYDAKRQLYYVSTLGDGITFLIPIEFEKLKNELRETVDKVFSDDKVPPISKQASPKDEKNDYDSNEDYKPAHAKGDYDEELSDEDRDRELINSIMLGIINGKYSLAKLREISEKYKNKRNDIDSLLETIDIQIDASQSGESKNKVSSTVQDSNVVRLPSNYINIDNLYKTITKTLIAQDEPLRRVLTEIVRKEQDPREKKRGLLLTGESGVGKTLMMSLIAKNLNKPFLKIDSTQLTVPGYVGMDIEEYLWKLYISCGKDRNKAESAIVFIDEIDKKGSEKKEDVSGKGVLNTLLPFIEGSIYQARVDTKKVCETVNIDTSKMTIIFGGAFEDVYKNLSKKDNVIGFDKDVNENGKDKPVSTEDFIKKAQMPNEFMGRVAVVKLNDLDVESIKRILLESDESAIKIQEQLFKKLGVKLTPGDDYINAIAERAIDRKTGARGLSTVVDESTWEAYADAYTNLGKYSEIILEKGTVDNPKQYKKVLRKGNN